MYKNPWNSGWRFLLLISIFLSVTLASIYFFKLKPKIDICNIYYSEISLMSCLPSNYGLPLGGGK